MDRQSTGFVPDIYRLLSKYGLTGTFDAFLSTGDFPSKGVWKSIIKKRINDHFIAERYNRLLPVMPMHYINSIFNGVGPCNIWSLCRTTPICTQHCRSAIKVLGKLLSHYQGGTCQKCNNFVDNLYMHLLFICTENENARNSLWRYVNNHIGYDKFIYEFCDQSWSLQILDMITGLQKYIATTPASYQDILRHMDALIKI